MSSSKPKRVAIIGGGPAGLCLALALSDRNIHSIIYERRGPNVIPSGGVALSPNAIRTIKPLGIFDRILPKSYAFENSDVITEQGEVVDRHYYGHERIYGYKAIRISRYNLLTELTAMVQTRDNTEIHYNTSFTNVINDSETGVTFEINNDKVETADMLIGADGIHSALRPFIDPAPLTCGGLLGIAKTIPRDGIDFPTPDFPLTAMIRGKHGAFLIVPEDPEARTSLAAIQLPYPELDHAGWKALNTDKNKIESILKQNYDSWGTVNRSIIDSMCRDKEDLFIWPYYTVPQISSWASPTRRVVLVGDSAHAVPPSTGQGVSQAFEDVYTLAYLLNAINEPSSNQNNVSLKEAVNFWQRWRGNRIKDIYQLVEDMNIKRMSDEERKKHNYVPEEELNEKGQNEGEAQYAWLFNVDFDREMDEWIEGQSRNGYH